MDYIITDFNLNGTTKGGIHFYDKMVYLEKDSSEMDLLRSYLFQLFVRPKPPKLTKENYKDRRDWPSESLEFIHTCRLSDYLIEETFPNPFDKKESYTVPSLDYNKLLQDSVPELLKYTVQRLERRVSDDVPDPVFATLEARQSEFLSFTKETAEYWGGPFELDGKVGCGVRINNRADYIDIDIYNFSYYSCSIGIRQELDQIAKENNLSNGDVLLASWKSKDKREYFDKLDRKDRIYILQQEIIHKCHKSEIESLRSYQLYLFGNDDASYSKYFDSEEEVKEELTYLRKMQPLDFNKDIKDRGYFFTN